MSVILIEDNIEYIIVDNDHSSETIAIEDGEDNVSTIVNLGLWQDDGAEAAHIWPAYLPAPMINST